MAKWNEKNTIYNRKGSNGGFSWNSDFYITVHQLNDTVVLSENMPAIYALFILSDNPVKILDSLEFSAFFDKFSENINLIESDASVSILFEIADSLGIKDQISDFAVFAYLEDKVSLLEELKTFAQILATENIKVEEITSINALLSLIQNMGLDDLFDELLSFIETHDTIGLTDHDPRQAISDFLIGAIDDDDRAYDWLIPFNLRVDWASTDIQVMPEAELTSIEIPGEDGSIIVDSVYKDRLFKITAFSEDGMTMSEREDLKKRITQVLDSTKHQTKKLTVQATSTSFDARYDGQADIRNGPSYVKAVIPLRIGPYGYDMFGQELYGNGLVSNIRGDAPMRPVFTIKGPISNPSFKLGAITYRWNGSISSEQSLIINFDAMTCYITDNLGNKTNALSNFVGEFQSIEAGKSLALVADENTANKIMTTWKTPVLW